MPKLSILVLFLLCPALAAAQENTVTIDRGLTGDRPYTLIYPQDLKPIDDGSATTVATLQHPGAPLQCDALIADGAPAGWTADNAVQGFDTIGIEAAWLPDFPGFTISSRGLTSFSSGPALLYEGESTDSPLGIPAKVIHAEAVDAGRTYILECIVERSIADGARPLIDFLIANFSTRSDGECCINPTEQ